MAALVVLVGFPVAGLCLHVFARRSSDHVSTNFARVCVCVCVGVFVAMR